MGSFRESKIFVIVVCAITIFVDSLAYSIVIPLLPTFQSEFTLTDTEVGILMATFALNQIIGSVIFGYLLDKFDKTTKHTLFFGLGALVTATVIFSIANSYWMLLLARCAQGMAAAASWGAAFALIPRNLHESERGKATAIVMAHAGIGSISGPVFCGLLVGWQGRNAPFYFLICAVALDAIAVLVLVEKPFDRLGKAKLTMIEGYKTLLTDVEVLVLMVIQFFTSFVMMGVEPIVPLLISKRFELDTLGVGLVYASFPLSIVAASPVAGWLTDKRADWRPRYITFGLFIGSAVLAPCDFATHVWQVVILCICVGLANAFVMTPVLPMINSVVEKNHGGSLFASANALANICWSSGGFLGPLVMTSVAGATNSYLAAFLTASASGVFASIFFGVMQFTSCFGHFEKQPIASSSSGTDSNIQSTNEKVSLLNEAASDAPQWDNKSV